MKKYDRKNIKCFSVYTNTKEIFNILDAGKISTFHSVRFLNMCHIIIFHIIVFTTLDTTDARYLVFYFLLFLFFFFINCNKPSINAHVYKLSFANTMTAAHEAQRENQSASRKSVINFEIFEKCESPFFR